MRRFVFFILISCCGMGFVFPQSKDSITICLEYEIPSGTEIVFSEDTVLALFIEEICADGIIIETFSDVRNIPVCPIGYAKKISPVGKINMTWDKRGMYYVWNDGRGIDFSLNDEGFYVPKTNSYRFPTDTKVLEIKYKVLLPTKGFNERDLEKQLPSAGSYTTTYRKKVELK